MGNASSFEETVKKEIQEDRQKYVESQLTCDTTLIDETQRTPVGDEPEGNITHVDETQRTPVGDEPEGNITHVDETQRTPVGDEAETDTTLIDETQRTPAGDEPEAEGERPPVTSLNGSTLRPKVDRNVSSLDGVDNKAFCIDPKLYEFPFENLVFEGGGSKGLAYCGAIRYLEEIGAMRNIKRLAGTSAGAMAATLVAVGYRSEDVQGFLSQNFKELFLDHTCGFCSLLPNLLKGYGWNPGKRIYEWFGGKLKDKTGSADITFEQLRRRSNHELCVVVANLSQMTTEYCHPKTTPDMPIRLAVRMSMSIPGMFMATKYKMHGATDVFVDGGILCNYPIHCFDGWYLSMAPGDSFIQRLQPLSALPRLFDKKNRFGEYNKKTLGFLLYSDSERDVLRYTLEKRIGVLQPEKPEHDTKLYRQWIEKKKNEEKAEQEHGKVVRAVDAFLKVLQKHNLDNNDIIDRTELEGAFKDEEAFPQSQAEILFGKDVDVQKAFKMLDQDGNGQINYQELVSFIEENGICLQTRFLGYQRKDVRNLATFLDSLQSTLLTNVKRMYVEDSDIERTVGINTGHLGTADFELEDADIEFVVMRGYNSCRAYLQCYSAEFDTPLTKQSGEGSRDSKDDMNLEDRDATRGEAAKEQYTT